MSDYIPIEMQIEIIKKIPIKSVIQFRSVSKQWKSSIDTSDFITDYTFRHKHTHHHHNLLVTFNDSVTQELKFLSVTDNDNDFPQTNFSKTVSQSVNIPITHSVVIGSSYGLLCLVDIQPNVDNHNVAVIWNPLIQKSVVIVLPDGLMFGGEIESVIGFGVCPSTLDPKIVKISDSRKLGEAEVFSLNSGVWRSVVTNLRNGLEFHNHPVVIDRFIYWLAEVVNEFQLLHVIIFFDLTNEVFGEINLPVKLARGYYEDHYPLFKLRENLVVITLKIKDGKQVFKLWMMTENGVSESFTKLFAIRVEEGLQCHVLGLRKNNQVIMESVMGNDYDDDDDDDDDNDDGDVRSDELVVYDPSSEQINKTGIYGKYFQLVTSYTESLLLLDR